VYEYRRKVGRRIVARTTKKLAGLGKTAWLERCDSGGPQCTFAGMLQAAVLVCGATSLPHRPAAPPLHLLLNFLLPLELSPPPIARPKAFLSLAAIFLGLPLYTSSQPSNRQIHLHLPSGRLAQDAGDPHVRTHSPARWHSRQGTRRRQCHG
jgi:hypothetical protein